MDIHEYAKARGAGKKFKQWLAKEPQVLCDWAMWADGKSVDEIYKYLQSTCRAERDAEIKND